MGTTFRVSKIPSSFPQETLETFSVLSLTCLEAVQNVLQSARKSQSLVSIKFFYGFGDKTKGVISEKSTSGFCQLNLSSAPAGPPFDIGHITFCHESADCAGHRANSDALKPSKGAGGPLRWLGSREVAQCRPLGRKQIRRKSK